MIISFFKNNNPASFIILPIFSMVLWVVVFITPPSYIQEQIMPLYGFLAIPVLKWSFLSHFIALLLIVIGSFLLNYICNENELLYKQSFLPALFYSILMSVNLSVQVLHPILFSNIFLMFAIAILMDSYRKDSAFSNAFNAGAFISLSVLFYFPNIFYFPLIGIALILFRPFIWREWIISFLGALIPFVFLLSYYFLTDKLFPFIDHMKSFFHWAPPSPNALSFIQYLPLLIGGLLLLLAIASVFNLSSNSQKSKKSMIMLFWMVLLTVGAVAIAPQINIKYFATMAIPFAVFFANYFLTVKKERWAAFLFTLFLISILFQQVYNFL